MKDLILWAIITFMQKKIEEKDNRLENNFQIRKDYIAPFISNLKRFLKTFFYDKYFFMLIQISFPPTYLRIKYQADTSNLQA